MKRRDFFELGAAMGAVLTAEAPRPNTRTCLARKEATAGAATSRSSDPLRKIVYAVATAGEGGGAPRGEELTFEEASACIRSRPLAEVSKNRTKARSLPVNWATLRFSRRIRAGARQREATSSTNASAKHAVGTCVISFRRPCYKNA